jgi:hypothetical protein
MEQSLGAKHFRSKSLVFTDNLAAEMLRPYPIGIMARSPLSPKREQPHFTCDGTICRGEAFPQ